MTKAAKSNRTRTDPVGQYQPGDPPPDGLVEWHEWSDVQHRAGLRQAKCPACGLWRYPQQLSGETQGGGRLCKACVRNRDMTFWTE